MDFRLIRAFCAVYEEGSINRAAARLRTAQPSISLAVRNLEADLKTALFDRSASGAVPTPAAHGLYPRLSKILVDLEEARRAVADHASLIGGPLRVALPPRLARSLFSTFIPPFLEDHPQVELTVVEVSPQRLVDLTIRGEVDLSITLSPPADDRLTIGRVAREPIALIASRQNSDVPQGALDLPRMAGLKLVVPGHDPLRGMVLRHIEADLIPIARTAEVEMIPAILDLVRASDWVALLPVSSIIGEHDHLVGRMVHRPEMAAEMFSIHSAIRPVPATATLFLDEAKKVLITSIEQWRKAIEGEGPAA